MEPRQRNPALEVDHISSLPLLLPVASFSHLNCCYWYFLSPHLPTYNLFFALHLECSSKKYHLTHPFKTFKMSLISFSVKAKAIRLAYRVLHRSTFSHLLFIPFQSHWLLCSSSNKTDTFLHQDFTLSFLSMWTTVSTDVCMACISLLDQWTLSWFYFFHMFLIHHDLLCFFYSTYHHLCNLLFVVYFLSPTSNI